MKVTPMRAQRWRAWGMVMAGMAIGGCGGSGPGAASPPRPTSSRNVIVVDEISAANVSNAYELVQRLRPHWLSRATSPETTPRVYVDRVHAGDLSALQTIPAEAVETMRFRSASEATTLYGTNHLGGAIEVTLKRGG